MEGDQSVYGEMNSPEYEKAGDHFGHEGVEFLKEEMKRDHSGYEESNHLKRKRKGIFLAMWGF